ncbi:MAG: hypothetical protein V4538_16155 [Bacteroidota bacterium]
MGKTIHYGIKLERAIKNKGLKKKFVAEKIGISRVWLDELLTTGKFTETQMIIVKQIIKK